MSTVTSATATIPNTSDLWDGADKTGANSKLSQNDFLKLLVSQIQYQDPLNPKSNTDMAAQMAQFTSLQQATDTSSSLAMIQANSLIGSSVTVQVDSRNSVTGLVSGVTVLNGQPQILVNGKHYQVSQVTLVQPPPLTSNAVGADGNPLQNISVTHTDPGPTEAGS
jgi:flagellar basal-body rod modification protein FlgD